MLMVLPSISHVNNPILGPNYFLCKNMPAKKNEHQIITVKNMEKKNIVYSICTILETLKSSASLFGTLFLQKRRHHFHPTLPELKKNTWLPCVGAWIRAWGGCWMTCLPKHILEMELKGFGIGHVIGDNMYICVYIFIYVYIYIYI